MKQTALTWSTSNLPTGSPENEHLAAQKCKDSCCGAATCTRFDHDKANGVCYFYQENLNGPLTTDPDTSATTKDGNWDHYVSGTCDWVEMGGEYAGNEDVTVLTDYQYKKGLTKEQCFAKCEEMEDCNSADYSYLVLVL